jgi:hypothetical protein
MHEAHIPIICDCIPLIKTILERALVLQRTKGTAEELLRLYLIGKRLYYTPAEELLRLR